jgi:hypothetical protein
VINIEVIVAQKPYERNVELLGYIYRKARWSPHGCNHLNPTHHRFLQKLKAGASGEQKHTLSQGRAAGEEFRANKLIHCVVTAYIFTKRQ